jgi:hypothetical protein
MIFCGQCGLQQAPGATHCPRCGAPVEGEGVVEEYYVDGPTAASFPYAPQTPPLPGKSSQAGAPPPNNPQKLVLGGGRQNMPGANEPTGKVDASTYHTYLSPSPSNQNTRTPDAGYPSSGNYSSAGTSYPGILPASMGSASPSSSYYPRQQSSQRSKGRVASLMIILFGLLLILGAMVVFALKQNGIIGGTNTHSGTGGGNTLGQQAQTLIQQYYTDINNKDYQDAYNLWKYDPNRQTYAAFSQGFSHTQHDDITIDNVTTLSDGTAKVSVTLTATEDVSSGAGTQTSVYKGYYIVGPENGVLKIFLGQLNKVS